MLVGPLSRSLLRKGTSADPEVAGLELSTRAGTQGELALEQFDLCRLAEILCAAKKILGCLEGMDFDSVGTTAAEGNLEGSGQGLGVLEAPRGILVHSYLVNRGRIERLRLLVATQFNNAFINLLIHDLAQRHVEGNGLSPAGERLIGRCIRLFDPCLSCATH